MDGERIQGNLVRAAGCRKGVWGSLILLAVLVAVPVLAEEFGEMGERYYKSGQYEEAIEAFKAAYLKSPVPLYLFNIAQAERQLGHKQEAVVLYERYLREDPKTGLQAKVQGLVRDLRAQMAEEQKAKEEAEQRAREERRLALIGVRPASERPIYKRWWFWTAIGVVAAGAVTAGAVAGTYHGAAGPPSTVPMVLGTWR